MFDPNCGGGGGGVVSLNLLFVVNRSATFRETASPMSMKRLPVFTVSTVNNYHLFEQNSSGNQYNVIRIYLMMKTSFDIV